MYLLTQCRIYGPRFCPKKIDHIPGKVCTNSYAYSTHPGLLVQALQDGIRVIIPSEVELAAGAKYARLVGDSRAVARTTARTHSGVSRGRRT